MKRSLILLVANTLLALRVYANLADRIPIPPNSPIRLFYIQRNTNPNTVVYDANILPNKSLNAKHPVHTYWLRYEDKGQKQELSTIQRTLAYGLYTDPIHGEANAFEGYFLAYRKRKFVVKLDPKGSPIALFPINGKLQILERVFINLDDNGLMPDIHYIELFGRDQNTGKDVYERFKP